MTVHDRVTGHYGRPGLHDQLLAAAERAGLDTANLSPLDLSAADQFHIGALDASHTVFERLRAEPGHHVLDVGSGIGGPARVLAHEVGCRVTGVDLTPEYTETARALATAVGSVGVEFRTADVTDLPFEDGTFDRAMMLHVGMNLPDKAAVFAEVRRVLTDDGRFVIFDLMRTGHEDVVYPVPWAVSAEASFLATEADYRAHLAGAGFEVGDAVDLTGEGLAFIARMREQGPQVLGTQVVVGPAWPERIGNAATALADGVLEAILLEAGARDPRG